MSDETRVQAIEKRLDPTTSRALALAGSGGTFTVAPRNMAEMMEFAKLMAISGPCVRPAFRGNPGACLAIALQAFRTGADPFAVANKAYITRSRAGDEQIAYEAQYIHAVVNGSGQLLRRLRPAYSGAGPTRKCVISGWIHGEEDQLEYESPTVGAIEVKNSPLWKSDPDQQLFYYSVRAWARRHLPEVILGMYTPEEVQGAIDLDPAAVREVPPRPKREDFTELPAADEAEYEEEAKVDLPLHVTEHEPPEEEHDEETGEIAEAEPQSEERAEFWSQPKLYVAPVAAAKGNRPDWQRTQMELLYWIGEARSADELGRLQADSKRTLDGLKLAYVGLYEKVFEAINSRAEELGQQP